MTVKLSPSNVTRLLQLYFLGFSQTDIAAKLGIHQATVSLYVSQFSDLAAQYGLEYSAKEYGIMDIAMELHSIGAELKKQKLAVGDAKKAIKVASILETCNIPEEDYKDVIAACIKMNNEGFVSAALVLHKIEADANISYGQIIKQASVSLTQLQQTKKELSDMENLVNHTEQSLASLKQQQNDVAKNLQDAMQKAGVDHLRLKKVESLAVALKKAGVIDQEISVYLERQSILNETGISIDSFLEIINQVKVATAVDGGKDFLNKLYEYGGLEASITHFKQKKDSLLLETQDLNIKVEVKGTLQQEITNLQSQKKQLQGEIKKLDANNVQIQQQLNVLNKDCKSLLAQQEELKSILAEKQALDDTLTQKINVKQQKVTDLALLETKRDNITAEVGVLNAQYEEKAEHLAVLEAFEGFVQCESMEDMEKFVKMLPDLINEAKKGKYSSELLRAYILKELIGANPRVMKCGHCGTKFYVDKEPPNLIGYHCPFCDSSFSISEDKNELDILRAALSVPVTKVKKEPIPFPKSIPYMIDVTQKKEYV